MEHHNCHHLHKVLKKNINSNTTYGHTGTLTYALRKEQSLSQNCAVSPQDKTQEYVCLDIQGKPTGDQMT